MLIRLAFFIILIGLNAFCFSQSNKIESILKLSDNKEDVYDVAITGGKAMYLPMDFGKYEFTSVQAERIKELTNAQIIRIDLVYTGYPRNKDFTSLNRKRLQSLYKLLPRAFESKDIEFRKTRQEYATTQEEAEMLPHGFYIYYRPLPTEAETKREINKLKQKLDAVAISPDTVVSDVGFPCLTSATFTVDSSLPDPKEFVGMDRKVIKLPTLEVIRKFDLGADSTMYIRDYAKYDSLYYLEYTEPGCEPYSEGVFVYETEDSTVSSVLRRHKWNTIPIVADVTGSMYPYTTQLLIWLKLNMKEHPRQFLFFNDGDHTEDHKKVIGKTGGLYGVNTSKFEEVEKTLIEAMTNGGGGDAPENNIEALLKAANDWSNSDSLILIADNWAPVKDISLLKSLKKPVKVVLCGVYGRINKDYLNLARATGGSVHLIERDIYDLALMKEGESIGILGRTYRIVGGEFVEIVESGL